MVRRVSNRGFARSSVIGGIVIAIAFLVISLGLCVVLANFLWGLGYSSKVQLQITAPPNSSNTSQSASHSPLTVEVTQSPIVLHETLRITENDLKKALESEEVVGTDWYKQFAADAVSGGKQEITVEEKQRLLKEMINIRPSQDGQSLVISANAGSPEDSREILEAVIDAYLKDVENAEEPLER